MAALARLVRLPVARLVRLPLWQCEKKEGITTAYLKPAEPAKWAIRARARQSASWDVAVPPWQGGSLTGHIVESFAGSIQNHAARASSFVRSAITPRSALARQRVRMATPLALASA